MATETTEDVQKACKKLKELAEQLTNTSGSPRVLDELAKEIHKKVTELHGAVKASVLEKEA